jgi:lipoate---protein ligase
MKCRLMDSGAHDAFWNMAADEAVLESVGAGTCPTTLRFYYWKPTAVSIGYFQSLREEVDADACLKNGVDIVRRMTGGGAVYHDTEFTYSFISRDDLVPDDILGSYELICSGLIEGLKTLRIKSEFAPLNDITAYGKKIGGNAQTRRSGCVLQHGTILLDVDLERMFSLLRVPKEKLRGKAISEAKDRVSSLKTILNREVTYNKACQAFKSGFAKAMDLRFQDGGLSPTEESLTRELAAVKYSTLEWNDRR